jgi:hypothetical protein
LWLLCRGWLWLARFFRNESAWRGLALLGVLARSAPKCWKIVVLQAKSLSDLDRTKYHVAREPAAENACINGAFEQLMPV